MVADIFGPDALVVAVIAAAVLFGAQRLPELARSVGRARAEFQRGTREVSAGDPPPPPGDGPPAEPESRPDR
jgi:TatA/E family protein of Tat protein translocase